MKLQLPKQLDSSSSQQQAVNKTNALIYISIEAGGIVEDMGNIYPSLILRYIHPPQTNRLSKPESTLITKRPLRAALDHLMPNSHPIFSAGSSAEFFRLLIDQMKELLYVVA